MKRPDIDEIKARILRATPGPWGEQKDGIGPSFKKLRLLMSGDPAEIVASRSFVLSIRQDAPQLLAWVLSLEAELNRAKADLAFYANMRHYDQPLFDHFGAPLRIAAERGRRARDALERIAKLEIPEDQATREKLRKAG